MPVNVKVPPASEDVLSQEAVSVGIRERLLHDFQ